MELQDEEVATEEPQLRYWNPWRRGRSVFTASSMPPTPKISHLQFVKMGPQAPSFCDSSMFNCILPNVYDNPTTALNQETPFQNEFKSATDSSAMQLSQTARETTIAGLNTLITLDTVPLQSPSFVLSHQEDEQKPFIKQEPDEEIDDKLGQEFRDDIVTFNSIDEALDSIDPPSTPDSNRSSTSINSMQGNGNRMGLTNEKHEEVVKAAKSLFSKRTRTLYHWLFPDTSKNKLKATVSAAWETLSEGEKHFYISQVLGRFGLQASSLMVNPQLGGMKCLPNEVENKTEKKKNGPVEDQRAVDSLFDSCEDAGNWASYSEPKPTMKPKTERKRRRRKGEREHDIGSSDADAEQEAKKLKKHKKIHQELHNFEEDAELTKELEKFRLITEAAEEDIWGDIPDPEELFAGIDF